MEPSARSISSETPALEGVGDVLVEGLGDVDDGQVRSSEDRLPRRLPQATLLVVVIW